MAMLKSGVDATLQTIDPNSKAGRVSLYGPDGQPLCYVSDRNRGVAAIVVRQTATTGSGAAVWALRCGTAARILYIRRIMFQLWFDGVGAATEMAYEWVKATSVTAMSGGVLVTPLVKRTGTNNPDVDCRVLDTGLTLTGAYYGSGFYKAVMARLTHSATQAGGVGIQHVIEFGDQPLELAPNEALVLRQLATSVIGDNVGGGVDFAGG